MSDDVAAVVWLQEGEPREDAARALAEWARVRGMTLVSADDMTSDAALAVDPEIGDRVEKEITRARDAVAALDADTAERALARAEQALREHPELPQAAWLRAEVDRVWAMRFSRVEPRDEARAKTAWQHAAALDRGRVAGVGEIDRGTKAPVAVTLVIAGAGGPRAHVFFDGEPQAGRREADGKLHVRVEAPPAEHQLVVLDGEVPIFASWLAIADGISSIEVSASRAGSCGRGALASAVRQGDAIRADGISCPRWVAAVPGDRPASVLVARCERDACGPLLEWRIDRGAYGPPQAIPREKPWPAWATWTLVGVGAATATLVTLVATGVLEARPVEQRFVAGGARVE